MVFAFFLSNHKHFLVTQQISAEFPYTWSWHEIHFKGQCLHSHMVMWIHGKRGSKQLKFFLWDLKLWLNCVHLDVYYQMKNKSSFRGKIHLEVKNTTLTNNVHTCAPTEAALILRVSFSRHPSHTVIFLGLLKIDIYRPFPWLVFPEDNPR